MLHGLKRLWPRPARDKVGRTGFVYTPDKTPGPLTLAKVGDVVSTDITPPWIVVDHFKDSIVFTNWPGTLWLVEVVDPAPYSHQVTEAYTRARTVRLIEKSSFAEVFGLHGTSVENILDQAARLELRQVAAMHSPEPESYDKSAEAWSRWLKQVGNSSGLGQDHSHTRGVSPRGYDSPVGRGFPLLFNVIHKRAKVLEGDAAFTVDSDGEIHFTTRWQYVFEAAIHAAMAYGAPGLLSDFDRQLLAARWEHCFKT
jgi:hypothetical protein